jgi:predicted ArsR family transcriptional regulator
MARGRLGARIEQSVYALVFRAHDDAAARAVVQKLLQLAFTAIAVERRLTGGESKKLLALARGAAIRFGRHRANFLAEQLGLDVDDVGDMGRLQDWEDRAFGVTGHWTERTKTRATKCETACPFARIAKHAPEICTDVVHALETATFTELNPRYRLVPLERLLSKGESACEFRHELVD